MLVTDDALVVAGGDAIHVTRSPREHPAPRAGALNNLTSGRTAPFNRPPRRGRPAAPAEMAPPFRKDVPASSRFSVITVVAPLILASAMMGDLRYGVIAALSPILGVGTWLEGKQRRKRELVEETARFDAAVAAFRRELDEAADVERARLRDEVPDPATVLRRASVPTTRLWERRAGTPGFLSLHVGAGTLPWTPPVEANALQRAVASARLHRGPLVLLVVDAEQFEDSDQSIAGLLGAGLANLRVVAAGRSDDLRTLYSHWTKIVRKARCGVLLQPNVDYDGELLGVTLPRRSPVAMTPGRGTRARRGPVLTQTASPQ